MKTIIAALTVFGVLIAGAAAAAPASADTYAAGGAPGTHTTYQVRCQYKNFQTSGALAMIVAPPRVNARNYTAGAGNDGSWARYGLFVVDAVSGAVVTSSGYSGWAWATDNVPATWSGTDAFSMTWKGTTGSRRGSNGGIPPLSSGGLRIARTNTRTTTCTTSARLDQ